MNGKEKSIALFSFKALARGSAKNRVTKTKRTSSKSAEVYGGGGGSFHGGGKRKTGGSKTLPEIYLLCLDHVSS